MSKEPTRSQYISVFITVLFIAIAVGVLGYLFRFLKDLNNSMKRHDLTTEVMILGKGEPAKFGDTVVVHYKGQLEDGTEFDSSYKRSTPFPVTLGEGRVIQGWEKGLQGVRVGEKRRLLIPSSLGYGSDGIPDGKGGYIIPPDATLIFEIEVIDIQHNS